MYFILRKLLLVTCWLIYACAPSSEYEYNDIGKANPFVVEIITTNEPKLIEKEFRLKDKGTYVISYSWNKDGPFSNPNLGIPKDLTAKIKIITATGDVLLQSQLTQPSLRAATGMDILYFSSKDVGLNIPLILRISDVHLKHSSIEASGKLTIIIYKFSKSRI
jgi:hypothetical protein